MRALRRDEPAEAGRRRVAVGLGAVAPLLLVVVATAQLGLAHAYDLTPWKGGGFGMFSTIDDRVLVVEVEVEQQRHSVDAEALAAVVDGHLIERAVSMPNEAALAGVAEPLLAASWRLPEAASAPGVEAVPAHDSAGAEPASVHVSVEEVRY